MIGFMDDMRFGTATRYDELRAEADARRLARGEPADETEAKAEAGDASALATRHGSVALATDRTDVHSHVHSLVHAPAHTHTLVAVAKPATGTCPGGPNEDACSHAGAAAA